MSEHQSLEQLQARQSAVKQYIGSKIQHVKSKGWYLVTGIHFREDDMSLWFSYETFHRDNPISFLRPIHELIDGRFAF